MFFSRSTYFTVTITRAKRVSRVCFCCREVRGTADPDLEVCPSVPSVLPGRSVSGVSCEEVGGEEVGGEE